MNVSEPNLTPPQKNSAAAAGGGVDGGVTVTEATEATAGLLAELVRILPQLSASAPKLGAEELEEIVSSPATHLLVAHDETGLLGSMTLVVFRIPTGVRAWIEDVVVDERARGRGVGEALNRAALALAYERGARTVDLTSRPSREAANRLYRKIGFEPRTTTVYRHNPASDQPGTSR